MKTFTAPALHITVPDIFIIESLNNDDIEQGRLEGPELLIKLVEIGLSPAYFYASTPDRFRAALDCFRLSGCRYLHLSLHGDHTIAGIGTDFISYSDLSRLMGDGIKNRRIFFSACLVGNSILETLCTMGYQGMYSFMAPTRREPIASLKDFYMEFYVKAIYAKDNSMDANNVKALLTELCPKYRIKMAFSYWATKEYLRSEH